MKRYRYYVSFKLSPLGKAKQVYVDSDTLYDPKSEEDKIKIKNDVIAALRATNTEQLATRAEQEQLEILSFTQATSPDQ